MNKTNSKRNKTIGLAILAAISLSSLGASAEPVKYRGIFINDEDWGLRPWAVKHFGKKQQIGAQVYEKIFSLMKDDGLNLLWPAMHEGGYEFVSRPENMELAAKWGIRIGTSHCEPMLRNNCYLSKEEKKKWSWLSNKDFIRDYWQWSVDRYAKNDVLWTIGMRGVHDGGMRDGKTMAEKIAVLEDVFKTQCDMLEAAGIGEAPKLFIPYKEVLPIFNSGLKVPKGTTIMWVNDNFGYVRRLGGPQCEGYGGGIYWHISYHGSPHGYIHVCTTPPAFMWYELVAKCSQNGVRDVWMINAGDVFQAEILLFALGKFAEDPDKWAQSDDPQGEVLRDWVKEKLAVSSEQLAVRIVAHLNEYYNLGFIRKPEHMCIQWSSKLPSAVKEDLLARYKAFLEEDAAIEESLDANLRDKYFEKVGFQARFLGWSGVIHLEGKDKAFARSVIDPLYDRWNTLDGGKLAGFWCDTIEENGGKRQPTYFNRWSSQMQWAWNEPDPDTKDRGVARRDYPATAYSGEAEPKWLTPVAVNGVKGASEWKRIPGLGTSGEAFALLPVKPAACEGAELNYELGTRNYELNDGKPSYLVIQFLPDFALWPGLGLGVEVRFDDGEKIYVKVPKSDSNIGEHDKIRNQAVQDNFIRVNVEIPEGAKTLTIISKDAGVVIDRVGVKEK